MAEKDLTSYKFEVLKTPVDKATAEELIKLLSFEDEPWFSDICTCLSENKSIPTSIFVVCRDDCGQLVGNSWIGWDENQTGVRVGLLGRVVTKEAHRGKGLATKTVQIAMSEFYGPIIKGSCLLLVVEEHIPYKIYARAGFKTILGGLEFNSVVMLHSKISPDPQEFLAGYFSHPVGSGKLILETTARRHSAAIVLLLCSFPTKEVKVNDVIVLCSKFDAEEETLVLIAKQEEGKVTSSVCISDGRVVGIEIACEGEKRIIMHPNFSN